MTADVAQCQFAESLLPIKQSGLWHPLVEKHESLLFPPRGTHAENPGLAEIPECVVPGLSQSGDTSLLEQQVDLIARQHPTTDQRGTHGISDALEQNWAQALGRQIGRRTFEHPIAR